MKSNCICCGSNDIFVIGIIPSAIIFAGRVLDTPLKGGSLIRCRKCNVSFRYPQLDKSSLDELYRQGKSDTWQTEASTRLDWQIARHWISNQLKKSAQILDVGCFDGGFLKMLDKPHRLFGIEIHEAAGDRAKKYGINLIGKDYAGLEEVTVSFDVITSFDVIEHTHNPIAFLEQLVQATNDGGYIIISTGNSDALSWKLLGACYWYCKIPEHISFINPNWCEWAGKKLGLEIVKISKFSHAQLTWKQSMVDIIKNVFYCLTPKGFALFRQMGMGSNLYRDHQELLITPPSWTTAQDHFICIFRKRYIESSKP